MCLLAGIRGGLPDGRSRRIDCSRAAIAILIAAACFGSFSPTVSVGRAAAQGNRRPRPTSPRAAFCLVPGCFTSWLNRTGISKTSFQAVSSPSAHGLRRRIAAILSVERVMFDPEAHLLEERRDGGAASDHCAHHSRFAFRSCCWLGAGRPAVFAVIAAVAVHNFAAASTLGSSLVRANFSAVRFWKIVDVFSALSPLDILIGGGFEHLLEPWYTSLFRRDLLWSGCCNVSLHCRSQSRLPGILLQAGDMVQYGASFCCYGSNVAVVPRRPSARPVSGLSLRGRLCPIDSRRARCSILH